MFQSHQSMSLSGFILPFFSFSVFGIFSFCFLFLSLLFFISHHLSSSLCFLFIFHSLFSSQPDVLLSSVQIVFFQISSFVFLSFSFLSSLFSPDVFACYLLQISILLFFFLSLNEFTWNQLRPAAPPLRSPSNLLLFLPLNVAFHHLDVCLTSVSPLCSTQSLSLSILCRAVGFDVTPAASGESAVFIHAGITVFLII